MKTLEELRKNIRETDRQLIHLISERLKTAAEIGKLKKEQSIPLRDFEVEKSVINNARDDADKNGVSPDLAEKIMELLINESCKTQEALFYTLQSSDPEKILIVGGYGQMGQWFARFFLNQGHDVFILDRKELSGLGKPVKSLEEGLSICSCTLISVSLDSTLSVINTISKTGYKGIVFDIASLKDHLSDAIGDAVGCGIRYTSIHPMFGPLSKTLSGRVLCFCSCGCPEADRKVRSFFEKTAVTTVNLSLKRHDQIIAYVLGLSHLVNITFCETLKKSGFSHSELSEVSSTTFNSQMITTSSVIRENPELYYCIQKLNPFRKEIYSLFSDVFSGLTDQIESGSRENFIKEMTEARIWLEKHD